MGDADYPKTSPADAPTAHKLRGSPSLTEMRSSSRNVAESRNRSSSVAFSVIESAGSYEALKLLAFENPGVVHSAANTKDEALRAFLAAEVGLDEIVKNAIVGRRVGINQKNEQGYSLLHIACYRGYIPLVTFLVDQPGIDLELKSGFNNDSPLLLAVGNGHKVVVEKLLRAGVQVPQQATALAERSGVTSILPLLRPVTPPMKADDISPRTTEMMRDPTPEQRSIDASPVEGQPHGASTSSPVARSGKLIRLKELGRQVGGM